MIKKNSLKIKNREGDNLNTDFRFLEGKKDLPLVIFVHGFKGFKDWGCWPFMLEKIAEAGNFVVSFNFSYNGVGNSESEQSDFTRLDLFAKNTFTRELDDLGSVINFLDENKKNYDYDFDKLALVGHSRGGGISILKTAEDNRVKKLITLAAVSNFNRYTDTLKKKWKEVGYFEVLNSRTNQVMRINYSLIEDLEKNEERLNIQEEMKKIHVPTLIIQGMQDITVDYSNAEALYNSSDKENIKINFLENTGHTFGAVHPFAGTTKALEEVIRLTLDFLKN